ncbi:DnaA N-terminal domain containing protein [uncultured Caudovirales phage]|uniref:DnaA N-terminal domain containing protein n=1 Tax=uncultured Caudovirales phage TaxID=2100421 RepID=A0A6J5SN45_9CAUD|nr:DnaA N-terminal domain containing protein [uncultured Caudovirales phage]CAB4173304.1 DnaA N-terminal domain containing protein [uncultured Caudovirales phage]CAB4179597.1 DnaA N-terminal domain containing protein [uncultured Caudovirales phage]CAB4203863.1 DnaA N-terminal domain containing protein [uncultured Caudovirales phage]CAB4215989.1 DnaA N-terminal domain containing protein [uncultured Caudovirales phage]
MPWLKIDENMTEHPKVIGLSNGAFRAHFEALCYAARMLTDGSIATNVARARGWSRSASALVEAELWEVAEGGWRIHDYLDFNPSKGDVEAGREAARERMKKVRGGANEQRSSTEVRANNGRSSDNPIRSDPTPTRTVPTPEIEPEEAREDSAAPAWVGFYQRACKLRGLISLSPLDEALIKEWVEAGVDVETWEAVEAELATWETPPDHPWGAFKSAMGQRVARRRMGAERPRVAPKAVAETSLPMIDAADADDERAWERVRALIGPSVTRGQFDTWIDPLRIGRDGEGLVIAAPSEFHVEWVTKRKRDQLRAAFAEVGWSCEPRVVACVVPALVGAVAS